MEVLLLRCCLPTEPSRNTYAAALSLAQPQLHGACCHQGLHLSHSWEAKRPSQLKLPLVLLHFCLSDRSPKDSLLLISHLSCHWGLALQLTVTQPSEGMLEVVCIGNRTLNSHPALPTGQRCQKMLRSKKQTVTASRWERANLII